MWKINEKPRQRQKADEGTIFIGDKPVFVYVEAVMTKLKNRDDVKVKAMGCANMGVAIDAVEKAIEYLALQSVIVEKGSVITGNKKDDRGSVSFIEIPLIKKK